jgi:hypothetical protein
MSEQPKPAVAYAMQMLIDQPLIRNVPLGESPR